MLCHVTSPENCGSTSNDDMDNQHRRELREFRDQTNARVRKQVLACCCCVRACQPPYTLQMGWDRVGWGGVGVMDVDGVQRDVTSVSSPIHGALQPLVLGHGVLHRPLHVRRAVSRWRQSAVPAQDEHASLLRLFLHLPPVRLPVHLPMRLSVRQSLRLFLSPPSAVAILVVVVVVIVIATQKRTQRVVNTRRSRRRYCRRIFLRKRRLDLDAVASASASATAPITVAAASVSRDFPQDVGEECLAKSAYAIAFS